MERNEYNLKNLKEKKNKIIEVLQNKGPALPAVISREIGVSLLLTSALLSDMRAERSVILSDLKIGGSPLYYIQGQKGQLEKFIKHLAHKEQEAFELLKKKEVVDETKLQPVQRVAFSHMKDFAFPIKVKTNEEEKTFWRFYSIDQDEASKRISKLLEKKQMKIKIKNEAKETKQVTKQTKEIKEEREEKKEDKEKEEKIKPKPRKKRASKEEFRKRVFSWLNSKNIKIVEELDDDDAFCKVSTKSAFGDLNFIVVAKKKKTINEADLSFAYQKGQQVKTPVLFLTTGKLTKKASSYIKNLGKFIIINSL